MNQIIIFSDNKALIKSWSTILSTTYAVDSIGSINETTVADLVILDSQKIDDDKNLISVFKDKDTRMLIFGSNWSETSQVESLINGVSGYCDKSVPAKILLQAVEQILKGDIWIQRLLVPKVIGSLVQLKGTPADNNNPSEKYNELLSTLSKRERDVAIMVIEGGNNKTIASKLFISERTVKAHLTSIYSKLNVRNRLHLVILLKEQASNLTTMN